MLYLLFAILCSSTIAMVFKYSEKYDTNQYLVTSINYLTAAVISLFMIVEKGLFKNVNRNYAFLEEMKILLSQEEYILGPYNSGVWGIFVGVIAGFFFFYSFIYYQKSVKENGVGLSGTFSKIGILIPMIFSIFIWKEYPTPIQWVGILLSLISIVMVNLSLDSIKKFDINKSIILLFLFGGMAEFSNKIYQKYAISAYKDIFLLSVFLMAFLISSYYTYREKVRLNKKDILTGIAVGVPNLFSSYFLILSLDTIPASIAFPTFSAGAILLINLAGFFIFGEKLSRKDKMVVLLILIALVFLNI